MASAEIPTDTSLTIQARTVAEDAKALAVKDEASFVSAAEMLKGIKGLAGDIVSFFAPLKKKAHEAHKALTSAESEQLAPLQDAERTIKARMAAWQEEDRRRRLAEERELQEAARRRAEEDRLLEAIDAETAGDAQAAAAILEAPPVLAPVVPLAAPVKVAGIVTRETWRAVVTDLRALARAVADGTVPVQALLPNTSFLDGQARALKSDLRYPGVVAQSEKSISASAGR